MYVRVNYGAHAGTVIDYPYHVGRSIVEAGRGERVDPSADAPPPPERVATAVPTLANRDPELPVSDGPRPERRRPRGRR